MYAKRKICGIPRGKHRQAAMRVIYTRGVRAQQRGGFFIATDENNILQSLCICITRDESRPAGWQIEFIEAASRNRYAFVSAENPEIDGLGRGG